MHWKRTITALFFALILCAGSETAQSRQPASIAAPQSHLALSDFYAHDPFILADPASKTYYLYTAIGPRESLDGHAGVVAYKSIDLKSWEGPDLVFSVPDGMWASPADGAWAPEVHRYRGKLYLFVTLHNNDKLLDEPVPVTHPIYEGKPAVHHLRGTQIFVAESPDGPFRLLLSKSRRTVAGLSAPPERAPSSFVALWRASPPFALGQRSITPPEFMALDGTLYVENEIP
jgi:hypothetical protein